MESFVWIVGGPAVGDRADGLAILSPAERDRLEHAPIGMQESFLAGRMLLRRLAGEQLGIAPADVPLIAVCPDCGGPHGRPVVEGSTLQVSLAHCAAGIVAAAAWDRPIGVDIESTADADRRRDAIRGVAGGEGLAHWTRVEATLKADGRGLRVDPREVRLTTEGAELVAAVRDRQTRYRIVEPDVGPAMQLSIAIAI